MLICRDPRDPVVDGVGWSDSHTGQTKTHLSITRDDQTNEPSQIFRWKPFTLEIGID